MMSSFIVFGTFLLFSSRQRRESERKSDKSRQAVISIHLHNIMLCFPVEMNGNQFRLLQDENRILL